jgi:hypothetical protein
VEVLAAGLCLPLPSMRWEHYSKPFCALVLTGKVLLL